MTNYTCNNQLTVLSTLQDPALYVPSMASAVLCNPSIRLQDPAPYTSSIASSTLSNLSVIPQNSSLLAPIDTSKPYTTIPYYTGISDTVPVSKSLTTIGYSVYSSVPIDSNITTITPVPVYSALSVPLDSNIAATLVWYYSALAYPISARPWSTTGTIGNDSASVYGSIYGFPMHKSVVFSAITSTLFSGPEHQISDPAAISSGVYRNVGAVQVPVLYKMRGYRPGFSDFEIWVSPGTPSLTNPSGQSINNIIIAVPPFLPTPM